MEFLIITGLSGAGKTQASNICEDLNYFCVDNFPPAMLSTFASLCVGTRGRYERVALVIDVRSIEEYAELDEALASLRSLGCDYHILYVEADTGTILRRYKESRRPHPMAKPGMSLPEAVAHEQTFLAPLREKADYIIDTTSRSLNQLRAEILRHIQPEKTFFSVNILSFGYKHGIPQEADLVFDVRCLPNPFYEPELRELRGTDQSVADYVFHTGTAEKLLEKITDLLLYSIPLYKDDRSELTIAVGCTGGHHRSVAMASALADRLEQAGYISSVLHRDVDR